MQARSILRSAKVGASKGGPTPWIKRNALGLAGALAGSMLAYHVSEEKLAQATKRHEWLSAIGKPNVEQRLRLLLTPGEKVAETLAPDAIAVITAITARIDPSDGYDEALAEAKRLNQVASACDATLPSLRPYQCSEAQFEKRFQEYKPAFKASGAASDYFTALQGRNIVLEKLIPYSTTVCNNSLTNVSITSDVTFHPDDELKVRATTTELAAGKCSKVFTAKLQKAPSVAIRAVGEKLPASQEGKLPRIQSVWGGARPEWQGSVAFNDTTDSKMDLRDPGTCFGRRQANCGGIYIEDLPRYAGNLAESLRHEREDGWQRIPKFILGVNTEDPSSRDVLGPKITAVVSGGPADALGLSPGDRIIAVGERDIFTTRELLEAVDAFAWRNGYQASIPLTFIRRGKLLHGSVSATFNRTYFDAKNEGFKSFLWSLADAVTLGNVDVVDCLTFRNFRTPKISYGQCMADWQEYWAAVQVLYRAQVLWGALIGSIAQPLRFVSTMSGFKVGALGGLVIEAAEGIIYEVSKKTPDEGLRESVGNGIQAASIPIIVQIVTHR